MPSAIPRKSIKIQDAFGRVTSVLDPPTLLQDLSGYTVDRVKEGSKYADTTLRHSKRTIPPAGGLALELYKEKCIGLLKILDVEEGEIFEESAAEREVIADSHRVFIREAEKGMQINAYMRILKTTSAKYKSSAIPIRIVCQDQR